jgi:DNA-binding LacI/PurR family transcriptional regulator
MVARIEQQTEPERSTRARLQDVAREAGVSIATASRALRGQGRVGTEMAGRVREAAIRVGYARPLREHSRHRASQAKAPKRERPAAKVVVVGGTAEADPLCPPSMWEGISLTLRGAGLKVERGEEIPAPSGARSRAFITLGFAEDARLRALAARVRVVSVCHTPGGAVDAVVADDFGGAHRVAAEALALGHRRVAVLTGPPRHSAARARERGVRAAIEEAHAGVSRVAWRETGWTTDDGYAAARAMLPSAPRPTLFICANDLQALGVVRAARERGLAVPTDVSVTGFGGLPTGPGFRLPLTTARVDAYAMGVVAAERLLDLLDGPSGPPRMIVLPAAFVPGESIAPPRRR